MVIMDATTCYTFMTPFTVFAQREMQSITVIKSKKGRSLKRAIIIIIIIISVALLIAGMCMGDMLIPIM